MAVATMLWSPTGLACQITLQYDPTQSNPVYTVEAVAGSTSPYPPPTIGASLVATTFYADFVAGLPVPPPPILSTPGNLLIFDVTGITSGVTNFTLLPATLLTGMYRCTGFLKITTAATTSGTLGPITIGYAADDGVAVTQEMAFLNSAGSVATSNSSNSATSTGILSIIPLQFFAKTGTAITITVAYSSIGTQALIYESHFRLETL